MPPVSNAFRPSRDLFQLACVATPPISGTCVSRSFEIVRLRSLVEVRQPRLIEDSGQCRRSRGQIDILLSLRMTSSFVAQAAGVVERLEDDAAGQRSVADDRHAMSIRADRADRRRLSGRERCETLQPAWPVMNRS